jgi:DnaA-homolog protein
LTQLVLDLGPPPAPSFDNFVVGDNLEALEAVRALAGGTPAAPLGTRFVYLWGPPGSGRSHLLQALETAELGTGGSPRRLRPDSPLDRFGFEPDVRTWLLDDCDGFDGDRQAAAFHLFNAVQSYAGARLASSGLEPPARLALMPELATRLGWGLVLQLKPLSDADTARALAGTLAERGINASPDVVPWLMTHAPRNLGSLRALVDALDEFSLERKRAITLPLLREFLQRRLL